MPQRRRWSYEPLLTSNVFRLLWHSNHRVLQRDSAT